MMINTLSKINDYCWTVNQDPGTPGSQVRLYGSEVLMATMDDKVLEQITNVAKLPGLIAPAMTMPDAHWGYGFPIGGVAAFDPEQGGIISAGGVGFDISCGIRCLSTNLYLEDIVPYAEELGEVLYRTIPAGVGVGGKLRLSPDELDEILIGGARWAVAQGYGISEDLDYVEERGCMQQAVPANVSQLAKKRQRNEMGTLGSGNHYLEVQVVKQIFDPQAAAAFGLHENQIIISIHCGSRGLGHQIGTDYLVSLAKAAGRLGVILPDRELACAPIKSPEGQQYIGAMNAGINCALANRQILTHLTRQAFTSVIAHAEIATLYDVSHNTCKKEKYTVNGVEKSLYIHRKGATCAFGPHHPALPQKYKDVGQPVVIGGSMGTASYILAGNPSTENKAFASASHGAGRALSRHQALRQFRGKELIKELATRGILIRTRSMRGAAEEAPDAYKDVNEVALATEKAGLARRVALLVPKICVKG
jgi:tRNA-splicing ligase RtcB (3'-phosphate/5'-hydroxy nucleic acid ligase)